MKINEPSLCIPRVFPNITDERVWTVFNELELGTISRIDMVPRETTNGDFYQRVFIHFKEWSSDDSTTAIRQRLVDKQEIKIIYDDPWYWKVSASRSHTSERRAKLRRQEGKPRPRIEFTDDGIGMNPAKQAIRTDIKNDLSVAGATIVDNLPSTAGIDDFVQRRVLMRKLVEEQDTPAPPPPLTRSWGSS
jgi:hypothetical protein